MLEIVKCVFVPRQEITLAVLDEGERPEPVDLQLEDEIVGVEGCGTAREPHGVEVSRQVDSHHAEYTKYLCFACLSHVLMREGKFGWGAWLMYSPSPSASMVTAAGVPTNARWGLNSMGLLPLAWDDKWYSCRYPPMHL